MAKMKFILRARKLYIQAMADDRVAHVRDIVERMHENEQRPEFRVSYGTIRRWVNEPDKVTRLDLPVLASFLLDGLGMTPEQIGELRLKDVFELVQDAQE